MTAVGADTGWASLFDKAFRQSQNAMLMVDENRCIVDANPAFARLVGRRRSTLMGHHMYDFVLGGPLLSPAEWRDVLSSDGATGEVDIERADGTAVSVQYAYHPEIITGRRRVLFVALTVSRWGRHFRRGGEGDDNQSLALSEREREVIRLVALGATSPEIAGTLHISHHTVRKHVDNAMRKMNARSRAHLVAKALAGGRLRG
jgi:PAS domain S-box-containing protein